VSYVAPYLLFYRDQTLFGQPFDTKKSEPTGEPFPILTAVNFAGHRVTIGSNGNVAADISAREVVIIGEVQGNIQCTDRLDIRSQGSLTDDVITHRISVEDGAITERRADPRCRAED